MRARTVLAWHSRRLLPMLLSVVLLPFAAQVPKPAGASTGIGFGKSLLAGASPTNPTSLQFGPDGRLYVAELSGAIDAYTVLRNGPNDYTVSAPETISEIQSIPNHDDDGTPNPSVTGRLVTGLLVVGTPQNPTLYVTSSDPRRGAFSAGDTGLDTNSGMISRVSWDETAWQREDLVRGLPRSEEIHATNGLQLDPATNTLYVAQGGNTDMGAPSSGFADLPEYALSAAILSVDLDALGSTPYDLPTLDDPTREGDPDANDPFGGDDGLNQAKLTQTGPVRVFSPGYRNPYDAVITDAGRMYVTDNGSNAGEGGPPLSEGPEGNCTNEVSEPGFTTTDTLHLVTDGYYGGHPNPTRGNAANTFGGQSPVPAADSIQCDYQTPGDDRGDITTFPGSTNGLSEYTASNFGGEMKGDLLTAAWNDYIDRIVLSPDGTTVVGNSILFSNTGTKPLDVAALGDDGSFPGTIWVADHYASSIIVFEPNDYGGAIFECTGADDPALDEDGDGYANPDEIDNRTDPCSAADVPPDNDGDGLSDRNDPDDDNDGRPDTIDRFAVDSKNGKKTYLPVRYTWDPGAPNQGRILNSGFTGLMSNGTSDYLSLFNPDRMIVGGAAGVFGVGKVAPGSPNGTTNKAKYGFQFGVNASPSLTGPFTVHTAIIAPFAGMTPQDNQQMGMFIGTGDQDNFVKLVIAANGGTGGLKFAREIAAAPSSRRKRDVPLPGPERLDLYLAVDPATGAVQPSYTVTTGGVTGPRIDFGNPVSVPTAWFDAATAGAGLAVGLFSTSVGPGPVFPATWDLIEVTAGTGGAAAPSGAGGSADGPATLAAPGTGEWESRAPSGPMRREVSFVEVGGKFYLAWGRHQTAQEAYDPETDGWTTLPTPLPADLDHIQGVALNGLIYYIGGLIKYTQPASSAVWIYDPSDDSWSQGTPMPRPRGAGGIAVHDGKIYYAGGRTSGVVRPWFDVYDPVEDKWSELPDMPQARDHFEAAVIGDRLYAPGGRGGAAADTVAAFDYYDFVDGQWHTGLAPLPSDRSGAATAVLGDEILVIGGENGTKVFDTVEAYDVGTDAWRTLAPMPTARHGTQAVVWKGAVYVAAGGTAAAPAPNSGDFTNVNEVYFPASTVRPDGLVKLAGDTAMLGKHVYNITGLDQTRSAGAAAGQRLAFPVGIRNDGSTPDAFTVQGPGSTGGFSVRYREGTSGTADVTGAVVAGTYTTPTLPPGGRWTVRLIVRATLSASSGSVTSLGVTVSSAARPTSKDVVGAVVTVT